LRLGLIKNLATFGTMPETPHHSLRILHLASWYPSKIHGTLGNFVKRHISAISSVHSGEVWYAAPSPPDQPIPQNTHTDCGNFQERIVYFKAQKPVVRGTTRALLNLAAQNDGPPFDVVHLHVAYPAGKAARTLARRWGIPLVVTEHWTAYHEEQRNTLPFWRTWSMRQTLKRAQLICPVSADLAQSIQKFGTASQFRVVPNVVDTALFRPKTAPSHSAEHPFQWLHISSLSDEQKNISGMIRAIQKLRQQTAANEAFEVQIIGDGNPKPHQALVEALGLQDCISVHGEISLEEVAEKMRTADALLLFSRYENFPCVIPEAWASGIPVLSTDVGGIREHLTEDRGELIESEDEAALAECMLRWIQSPSAFDRNELRTHAMEHFSMAAVGKAYSEVYGEALESMNSRQA